jgi:hypothetical protein
MPAINPRAPGAGGEQGDPGLDLRRPALRRFQFFGSPHRISRAARQGALPGCQELEFVCHFLSWVYGYWFDLCGLM